jgi:hypothetical protein
MGPSLAAEVRDPAWFLARQWQVGELSGQDAGSPAFVSVTTSKGTIDSVTIGATTKPFDSGAPIEAQALSEPFSPDDLSLQVELGQVLADMIDATFGAGSEPATRIKGQLLTQFPVAQPTADRFDPLAPTVLRFLTICAGRAINGVAVYLLGGTVPAGIGQTQDEIDKLTTVLGDLGTWVRKVWGAIGTTDPSAWVANRLRYDVSIGASTPGGGRATLSMTPDGQGEAPWSAFDVTATTTGSPPPSTTVALIPGQVRFPGMPSWRFWDFESNEVALPDVHPEPRDLVKLLALDFMVVHGQDWFLIPVVQDVGSLARIDSLIVTDVFGRKTSLDRADAGNTAPGLSRWTTFSQAKIANPPQAAGLADFFLASPSFGSALQGSRVLEEVRFARDEMANMAWAIERQTPTRLGRARNGGERDAAVEAVLPAAPPTSTDTTSPLRYLVETPVPINYVPLVAVPLQPGATPPNPAIILQKAANARPVPEGGYATVAAASKIMKPGTVSGDYQIFEEEVPRLGTTVERVVFRSRWTDGSTHLWIQRRRRTGAGETQAGLRFDAANPIAR